VTSEFSHSLSVADIRVDTADGKKPILTVAYLFQYHQYLETKIKKRKGLSVMAQKGHIVGGDVCLLVSPWCVFLLYQLQQQFMLLK
jgi:hypothetical protein